jgi:2,4-diaminopentanoate dehydrogenase
MKKYKIIQWAPGYIGTQALKYIIKHPLLELVGVKCFSDSKVGVDAGTLCGMAPVGVKATKSEEELLALDADCVIFTCGDTSMQDPHPGTLGYEFLQAICRILESGKNVVSTTPMQMVYPKPMGEKGQKLVDMLNASCAMGKSSVHFIGIEPGFMADIVPSIMSSISMDITSIRTTELIVWGNYDKHDTLEALGFGRAADHPSRPVVLGVLKSLWSTTIQELADTMNITLDEIRIWDKPVVAEETFVTAGGLKIEKGTVAVAHWAVEGMVNGLPRVAVEHINRMRPDLAPEFPSFSDGDGYLIQIDSNELPVTTEVHFGRASAKSKTFDAFDCAMYGTVARAINSIEAVCKATPGCKSKEDLPPLTGRNAMWV